MKKYIYLLMAVCTLAFAGCNDDDDPVAPVLEIVTSDIGFDAAGGTGTITLKSTDAFSAVSDKGWLTITGTTATAINYSVAESSEALQRAANITVTAGNQRKSITILQQGAIFTVGTEPISVDPTGKSPTVIAYDTSMQSAPEVTIPENATGWLSSSVADGKITLNATLNYTGARSTVITVRQAWKPVEITVTQDMVDLVDTKQIARDREAATDIVVTPTEYLAMASATWDVQTDDAWITLNKEADKFTVSLTENTSGALRNGTIKVVSGEGEELTLISVSQKIYSYEFFLGVWIMVYAESQGIPVTFAEDPEGPTGYIADIDGFEVFIGYEDRGTTAALTITTPQYMGLYNYTSGGVPAQANIFLLPTTTTGTNFNTATGLGYDCIYNLDEAQQILLPQANAVTTAAGLTINGLILAGQNTVTNSWVNFGNYHPFIGLMRPED